MGERLRVPGLDSNSRSGRAELRVLRDSTSCTHAVSVTFPILTRLGDTNGVKDRTRQVSFCALAFGERIELWSSDPEFGGGGSDSGASPPPPLLQYTGATWRADAERRIDTLEVGERRDGDRVLLVTLAARSPVEVLIVAWNPDEFALATVGRLSLVETDAPSTTADDHGSEKKTFTLPQRSSSPSSSGSQRVAPGHVKSRVSRSWVAHQTYEAHLFLCDLAREPSADSVRSDDEWIRLVRSLVVPPKVVVPSLPSASSSSSSVAFATDDRAPGSLRSDGTSSLSSSSSSILSSSHVSSTTASSSSSSSSSGPVFVWCWPSLDERARGGGDIVDFAWLDSDRAATAPDASAKSQRLLAVLRRHALVHPERTLLHPFACSLTVVEIDMRRRTAVECHSIRNLASDFFRIVPVPSAAPSSSYAHSCRPSELVALIAPNAIAILRDAGRVLDSLHLLNDRLRFADGHTPGAAPECLVDEGFGVCRSRSACPDHAVPTEFAAKRGEPIVLGADTVFLVHAHTRSIVAVGCSVGSGSGSGGGGGLRSHGVGQVATLTLDEVRDAVSSASRVRLRARRLPLGPTRAYASCATWLAAATDVVAAPIPSSTATIEAIVFLGSRIGDSFAYRVRANLVLESLLAAATTTPSYSRTSLSSVASSPSSSSSSFAFTAEPAPTSSFGVAPDVSSSGERRREPAVRDDSSVDDLCRRLLERARQRQNSEAARFRSWHYDVRSLELRTPLQTWRTNGVVSGLCRPTGGGADLAVLHGYAEYGQLSLLPAHVDDTESSDDLRAPEPVVHVDLSAILASDNPSSSSSSTPRGDKPRVANLWALSLTTPPPPPTPPGTAAKQAAGEPRWLIVLQLDDSATVALLFFGTPATDSSGGSHSSRNTNDDAAMADEKRPGDGGDNEAPEFRRVRTSSLGPPSSWLSLSASSPSLADRSGATILALTAFGTRLLCVTRNGVVAEHRLVRNASANHVIVGVRSVNVAGPQPSLSSSSPSSLSDDPTRREKSSEAGQEGADDRLAYCRVIAPTVVFVVRRDSSCALVYRAPPPSGSGASPRDTLSWRIRNLAYPRGDDVRAATAVALSDRAPHLFYAADDAPRDEQESKTTTATVSPSSSSPLLRVYVVPTAQSRELRRHATYRISDLGAARIFSVLDSRPATPSPPTLTETQRSIASLQVIGETLTVELDDGQLLVYDTLGHGRVLELRYSQSGSRRFSAADRAKVAPSRRVTTTSARLHRNDVACSDVRFWVQVGDTVQCFAVDRRRSVRATATYRIGGGDEIASAAPGGARHLAIRRPVSRVVSGLMDDAGYGGGGGELVVSVGDNDHILQVVRLATTASSRGSLSSTARSTDEIDAFGRTHECRLGATPRFIVHLPLVECFAVIVSTARPLASDAAQDDHDSVTSPVLPPVLQYELLYCSAHDASVIGRYGEFRPGERVTSLTLAPLGENKNSGGGGDNGGGGPSIVERLLVTTAVTESADFASTGRLMMLLPSAVIAIVPLPSPQQQQQQQQSSSSKNSTDPRRPSPLRTTRRKFIKTRLVAELLDRPFTAATTLDVRYVVAAGDHRLRVYAIETATSVRSGDVRQTNASSTATATVTATTAGMRFRLVTWCDGPYYCRNLWRVGARYVYWEDRARNVFMGVWDPELLALVVVAPPAPETRRFRATAGPTLLLRHGSTVEFLAYGVDVDDDDENQDASRANECIRVWRTRLEARPHTEASLALAHFVVADYPLARLGRRMTMATERVRGDDERLGTSCSNPLAPPTPSLSSFATAAAFSFSSSSSSATPPRFADALRSDSSALAFAIRQPTCGVADDATVWIANDRGAIVASTRRI